MLPNAEHEMILHGFSSPHLVWSELIFKTSKISISSSNDLFHGGKQGLTQTAADIVGKIGNRE